MKNKVALLLLAVAVLAAVPTSAQNYPFPQHVVYAAGIKPNNVTQAAMDSTVSSYWSAYSARYVKSAGGSPTRYYIAYNLEGQGDTGAATVSEAHGYGMVMEAYFADKTHFDGMYWYYKDHPSQNNSRLMAWQQNTSFVDMGGADSATDGDMDIAYSLLLADKQWGSDGTINYLSEATNMINALMQSDVNQSQWTLRLGDWATSGTSQGFAYATSTRPSDFMFDHMQSYYEATGDGRWTNVMAHTYAVVNTLFNNNSPNTGLIPDFVVLNGSTYQPAPANFLEAATDGEYNYNSCRTPWRFATDYLLRNTSSILTEMRKMNSWIQSSSGGNANNVYPGYNLGGGALNNTYTDDSFTSPFGLCAMIDSGDQTWLNTVWTWIAARGINVNDGYFGNSITMQCAIVLSGNWWKPVYAASSSPDFTITETPASQTVTAGNATNYTVNIGTVNGFTGTVGLSAAGLPAGATAAFNPTSVTMLGSSTMTVTTATNTPTGSKTLTVIGTSGTLVHSNTVTLTVNAIGGGGGSTNNLALNQTASASTTWSASYAASYAVDGNPSTRWSAASGQTNNQWLLVDFGTATAYSSVVIKEISFQRVTAFKIQSSTDGTTFTDLATGTTIGTNLTVTFSTVSARYVRLFVTSASNVPTINEFEVYGSGSGGGAVAAPTFSPAGGTYTSAQSVTISTTTGGASIRYTTDGSTPNETAGTLYSTPVTVSSTTTLKAIAYETGYADSSVASAAYTISSGDSNIAPNGTAYGWNANTSATANGNRTAQAGLNDNNLTADVDIDSAGDAVNAWEGAGVVWSSAKTISAANFINGTVTSGGDGFLTANCKLQFSTDGSTWVDSGWTVSPAYPNSSAASGQTYAFSGTAVSGKLGARVVGQVRTTDTSYHWIVKEVRFIGH